MNYFKAGALVVGAALSSTAIAGPTAQLEGGATTVQLDPGFVNALVTLGVAPAAIEPGRLNLNRGTVRYAIPAGVVDVGTLKGDIFHTGGLSLSAGDTELSLLNFIISTTGDQVLTGVASVNGDVLDRLPLFDLNIEPGDVSVSQFGLVRIQDVEVTLTDAAAGALNAVFGVDDFVGGFAIGTARVTTRVDGASNED